MKRILACVLLISVLIAFGTKPAAAQSPWTCHFDFTQQAGGWTDVAMYFNYPGPLTDDTDSTGTRGSSGWVANTVYGNNRSYITITIEFAQTTITSVQLEAPVDQRPGWMRLFGFGDLIPDNDYSPHNNGIDGSWVTNRVVITFGQNTGQAATIQSVTLSGEGINPFSQCGGSGPGLGNLVRPLAVEDMARDLYDLTEVDRQITTQGGTLGVWYMVNPVLWRGGSQTVHFWSNSTGALVHAAKGGTVESVNALNWRDCGLAFWTIDGGSGLPVYNAYIPNDAAPCAVGRPDLNQSIDGNFWPESYYLDPQSAYTVTIDTGDFNLTYLVKNANRYVVAGDTINDGCVIGETMAVVNSVPITPNLTPFLQGSTIIAGAVSLLSGPVGMVASIVGVGIQVVDFVFPDEQPTPPTTNGYGLVFATDDDDSLLSLLPSFTVEPNNQQPCNQTAEFSDCNLANPRFTGDGYGWEIQGGNVQYLNPGIIIRPGTTVAAAVNLDSQMQYNVTVRAQALGAEQMGNLRVFLGSHTQRFDIIPEPYDTRVLEIPALGDPDQGLFYSVGFQNTGTTDIEIQSICIRSGDTVVEPGYCTFPDKMVGWAGENTMQYDGSLVTFSAYGTTTITYGGLELSPDTYRLDVEGEWSALLPTPGMRLKVEYRYPDTAVWQAMSPEEHLLNPTGLHPLPPPITSSAEFVVTEQTSGNFELRITFTPSEDTSARFAIHRVCLRKSNSVPPFTANCRYVSMPVGDNPAHWINYHWLKLNQFFECSLMKLLNRMWQTMRDTYQLIGWSVRYNISFLLMANQWADKQLFPWLGGHFRNMAVGTVVTVYGGQECHDIFCLIDGFIRGLFGSIGDLFSIGDKIITFFLELISRATSLLFSLVEAIITLVLAFISQMLNLLLLGRQLLASLISAYNNSAAIPIPGLPYCAVDPRSHPICVGVWTLDNTIFSGPGAAVIPLIVGILSIHLILWVVGEIRHTVIAVGQSS